MNKDIKVSNIQVRGLIVSTAVGVGILSLPNALAETMGNKGWIAILISGILTLPVLAIINQLFKQNPNKDFFEIGDETLGIFIFTICKLIFLAYLIVFLSFITRNLGELIKAFLLPTTPISIIVLLFILSTSYIACYEIDVITRMGYILYPIIIMFAVIIVLIALPKADFTNLLPLSNIDIWTIPKGIGKSFFSFTGFEMIIFAIPFVENKDKVFQSCVYAIGTVTLIYIAIFIMTLSHFSIKQIQRQTYPVLQLVKNVDLPGYFVENLDGLIMAIWVIVIFATMAPAFFGSGKILAKIFKTKKHKYFIWGLIPVIYFLSLVPKDLIIINNIMLWYYNILALTSIIIIPSLMLLVDSIKKKVKS